MLRKCAAVLAVVSCLAAVTSARAEPGPVGQWLMNEPASLFDIGMIRLKMEAKTWELQDFAYNTEMKEAYGQPPGYIAGYDWDENRIVVQGWLGIKSEERPDAELACKKVLSLISDRAGVVPDTGKFSLSDMTNSVFADYFSHIGYEVKDAPEDYKSRLDQIFLIKANILLVGEYPKQFFACSRRLLSNKIYFEE